MMPLRFGNLNAGDLTQLTTESRDLALQNFLKIQKLTKEYLEGNEGGELTGPRILEEAGILANLAQATGVRINFNA